MKGLSEIAELTKCIISEVIPEFQDERCVEDSIE